MIGEMTRKAFVAWLATDRGWEQAIDWLRREERENELHRDTLKAREKVAQRMADELASDENACAVVFRGEGADDVPMLCLDDVVTDKFGVLDGSLVQFKDHVDSVVRHAFHCFWESIFISVDAADRPSMFQEVMLYLRSQPCAVRRRYKIKRMFAVQKGDGEARILDYLPWTFTTIQQARRALRRLAKSCVPKAWNRYCIVVEGDVCEIENLWKEDRGVGTTNLELGEIRLASKQVEVPEDFATVMTKDGNLYVGDWETALTKNWYTRTLTMAEWLERIHPVSPYNFRNYNTDERRSQAADKAAGECDWWKIDLNRLEPYYWAFVLSSRPDFAERCSCWGQWDDFSWDWLLRHQPKFADRVRQ